MPYANHENTKNKGNLNLNIGLNVVKKTEHGAVILVKIRAGFNFTTE